MTDRSTDPSKVIGAVEGLRATVAAEQVHGASVAAVGPWRHGDVIIAGCDALLTDSLGVALLLRTADCLPMFFAHPACGTVGLAHAGWRGLAAQLPMRVVAALRRLCCRPAEELTVAIGPAIHACCYDVGPEFADRFGPFVREHDGRRTCDLIGVAVDQLRRSGVRPDRIADSGRCTACDPGPWFSVRRDGGTTGRLASFIMAC